MLAVLSALLASPVDPSWVLLPRAEGQHALLDRVVAGFGLSDGEADWLRRGRNASSRGPRRLDPKVYRASTAFETLVGALLLTDPDRLGQLWRFLFDGEGAPVAEVLRRAAASAAESEASEAAAAAEGRAGRAAA